MEQPTVNRMGHRQGEPSGVSAEAPVRRAWWLPWVGVGALSAMLRLHDLGLAPLSPAEASEALASLSSSGVSGSASSGLLAAFNTFVFWLLGPSDVSARLVPALVGTLLPLSMLLFARYGTRRGALITALLLALSPSLTLFSRTSSGMMLSCAAVILLLGSLLRHSEDPSPDGRWLWVAGAALGLGISSGGAFLSLGLTLVVALLLGRPDALMAACRDFVTRKPMAVAAASFVLGATFLFFFPAGLGVSADGLSAWLNGFRLELSGRALGILLTYELLILLSGLCGLVLGLWRGDSFARTWALWVLAGLVLMLVRPGQPDVPLLLLIPLAFLGSMVIDAVLSAGDDEASPLVAYGSAAALVLLGAHIATSLGQYGRQIAYNSERATAGLLLAGVSGILVVGVIALIWTYSRTGALRGLTMALSLLLAVYAWGSAWELGHDHQADPRELWVEEATAPGARILVDTLRTTSERARRASFTLPAAVQADEPVLRWLLRDFTNVSWVDSLQPGTTSEAVVTSEELDDPLLGSSYLGMDLTLISESPTDPPRSLGAALRWLLLRDAAAGGQPVPQSRLVVWIRQDVSLAGSEFLGQ